MQEIYVKTKTVIKTLISRKRQNDLIEFLTNSVKLFILFYCNKNFNLLFLCLKASIFGRDQDQEF